MNTKTIVCTILLATLAASTTRAQDKPKNVEIVIDGVAGFQDTPMQPDGKWHVHDPARPQPPVVTPGTFSTQATQPSDAIVLFDGKSLSNWRDKKTGGPAPWTIDNGAILRAGTGTARRTGPRQQRRFPDGPI